MLPYSNPVSTAFCTQALTQWQAQRAGRFEADLAALI
jgi:hypothetical protein